MPIPSGGWCVGSDGEIGSLPIVEAYVPEEGRWLRSVETGESVRCTLVQEGEHSGEPGFIPLRLQRIGA